MACRRLPLLIFLACALLVPRSAQTEPALVIRSDRGGLIAAKLDHIDDLRRSGRRVEIRGTCLSSCTMLLGLDAVCVAPRATLGFHGPSSHGRPLHPADFEQWSQVIARHYAPALRRWYLNTGRHRLRGYYRISGAHLIKMGYPACQTP